MAVSGSSAGHFPQLAQDLHVAQVNGVMLHRMEQTPSYRELAPISWGNAHCFHFLCVQMLQHSATVSQHLIQPSLQARFIPSQNVELGIPVTARLRLPDYVPDPKTLGAGRVHC
jgi:hypothetical protein